MADRATRAGHIKGENLDGLCIPAFPREGGRAGKEHSPRKPVSATCFSVLPGHTIHCIMDSLHFFNFRIEKAKYIIRVMSTVAVGEKFFFSLHMCALIAPHVYILVSEAILLFSLQNILASLS